MDVVLKGSNEFAYFMFGFREFFLNMGMHERSFFIEFQGRFQRKAFVFKLFNDVFKGFDGVFKLRDEMEESGMFACYRSLWSIQ